MMDCTIIRRYLTLYHDSELGPEMTFEISRHLEECSACQQVFQQESNLESRLRLMVTAGSPNDDFLWSRSLRRVTQHRLTPIIKSPVTIGILALTAVAVFIVLLQIPGSSWHHELDLAAATEAAHLEFLEKPSLHFAASGGTDHATEYFQKNLSPDFALSEITQPGVEFFGGNLCSVKGTRTAHLLYYFNEKPISVFWFDGVDLEHFPDVSKKLLAESSSLHCKVNQDQFYVRQTENAIFCGIGDIEPGQLQELVDSLSSSNAD